MQVKCAWYHFCGDGIMEIINYQICSYYGLLVAIMRYSNHEINCIMSYNNRNSCLLSHFLEKGKVFFCSRAALVCLLFPIIHCIDIAKKLFIIQHLNFLFNPFKSLGMKISSIKLL